MKQMYKVFLNDRVIKIGPLENITRDNPSITFSDSCCVAEISQWFNAFETSNIKEISILHSNPEIFITLFQNAFHVIHAAGGVVLDGNQLLFIFRYGKWDLPKGKLNPDEMAEDAAFREVEEETGIRPQSIQRRLPSTFHIYKSQHPEKEFQWIFKDTSWFQMTCIGKLTGIPQLEEGITQVKWIPKSEIHEVLENTHENLKQIINLYCD